MRLIKITLVTLLLYTICGISICFASAIEPGIKRISLSQGERKYESVTFQNTEDTEVDVLITPYKYNPQTDEISEDKKQIFIKADTDSIKVKAKSSYEIKYEIYPISNLEEGTYFNILALTPLTKGQNISINTSIAQLIILDIVSPQDQVKGVATESYSVDVKVINKGIPFVSPLRFQYTIRNNSNYMLTPSGRLDVFNEKNKYKSIYVYLNPNQENVYPKDIFEKDVKIQQWHFSDIFLKRIIKGEVYNGIDGIPKQIEIEVNNFIPEFAFCLVAIVISVFFVKSLLKDFNRRKKER